MLEMRQVEDLFGRTVALLTARQSYPESTYRLQFHAGFTFRDAVRIVPYLHDLGVTHIYASPYLRARAGSTHGYDITDHKQLNPEIGPDEDYAAFIAVSKEHELGQILDTVPNHMGVFGNENAWWNDVLENGPASPYATYFDIAWYASPRPELQGRLLLPVLGDLYGRVLQSGQLRLEYANGAFTVAYFDYRFPVSPPTYGVVLEHRLDDLKKNLAPDDPALLEYLSIQTAVKNLPPNTETDAGRIAERLREQQVVKRRLAALTEGVPAIHEFIAAKVTAFNGTAGDRRSFDMLDGLLNMQAYRLCFWRVATDEINYRRFFDVNELAALSMERPEVFDAAHEKTLELLRNASVNGLRIDHPDGLFDPRGYLCRLQEQYALACARTVFDTESVFQGLDWSDFEGPLRERIGEGQTTDPNGPLRRPLYVLVEKILGSDESLRENWPVHGTSGYDFLNRLNGLFVDGENGTAFTHLYRDLTGIDETFSDMVYQKKFLILQVSMASELHMLAHQLDRLAQNDPRSRDFSLNTLRHALREVIACFPVYRSYIEEGVVAESDRRLIETAVRRAKWRNPVFTPYVFDFIRDVLLLRYSELAGEEERAAQRRFVGKFEQVTSPVMAKGLEDTVFYVFNRLQSLNEVGGDASRFGVPPEEFHRYNLERQGHWPWSMSTLSTHDTKRSEAVRARLNVLSEMPDAWREAVGRWRELNARHHSLVDDEVVPDANEEYLLYQTLLGAWPLDSQESEPLAVFVQRIQEYMVKALHEAKVHTSWVNPNAAYDEAVKQFVAHILDPEGNAAFLDDFRSFQRQISHFGLFNSLAQTLLKITAPGVPDTYQGTELWDFSLVDPDNRRPVDYDLRRRMLAALRDRCDAKGADRRRLARELLATRNDGRIKLYVITESLHCRKRRPGFFSRGEYLPLQSTGRRQMHVFAFARRDGDASAIVAAPRLLARRAGNIEELPLGSEFWQDTSLLLPDALGGRRYRNAFTGVEIAPARQANGFEVSAAELFADFPVALLIAE